MVESIRGASEGEHPGLGLGNVTVDDDLGENGLKGVKGAAPRRCACARARACAGAVEAVGAESAGDHS